MSLQLKSIQHTIRTKSNVVNNYFSNLRTNPERMVVIGFIAADGYIPTSQPKRLCIGLSQKDQTTIDMLNDELTNGTSRVYCRTDKNGHKSCSFTLWSDQITNDLSKFGIRPRKTFTLRFPKVTDQLAWYWLRGLFYGDGCVYKNKYFLAGNSVLMAQIKSFLRKQGISSFTAKIARCPKVLTLTINSHQGVRFSSLLFSDDKMKILPRKHIISSWQEKNRWLPRCVTHCVWCGRPMLRNAKTHQKFDSRSCANKKRYNDAKLKKLLAHNITLPLAA